MKVCKKKKKNISANVYRVKTFNCLPWDYFLTPFDTWLEDQYQQYMTLNTGEERVLKDCVCD